MLQTELSAPTWVDSQPALDEVVAALVQHPIVAVDTESNSLYAYREQVCLVQFSTEQVDYVIDPITLADLSSLGPLFHNPSIEKVFHAAEYDIICFRRDFGFDFTNLFDTMIAARILGRTEVGLGALLEAEFGVVVDKHFQRSNWGQRPLTPAMLAYARLDTHYLLSLRERLLVQLQARDLWGLAQEDFKRVCLSNGRNGENGAELFWRITGAQDLEPHKAAVLRELYFYRETQAQLINQPPFKVLGNNALLEIAQTVPHFIQELDLLPGMIPSQVRRHARGLFSAVQRGLAAAPPKRPQCKRLDDKTIQCIERLHTWRKHTAQVMKVDSDVVLPRDVLRVIAESNPGSLQELVALMVSVPWRFQRFGEDILHTLHPHSQ
jgi:ribonuclease D